MGQINITSGTSTNLGYWVTSGTTDLLSQQNINNVYNNWKQDAFFKQEYDLVKFAKKFKDYSVLKKKTKYFWERLAWGGLIEGAIRLELSDL